MQVTLLHPHIYSNYPSSDPSVQITALVAQLVALPAGKLLEKTLPRAHITTFGYTWSLNPGPFNIKEHTLITVMANVVAGGAYATDIIAAQRLFYQQYWGATYQLALVVSTQMFGFSLAGICRRFLVWPSSMIWPATLVNTA
jgi:OPT family oligopeptide transporter